MNKTWHYLVALFLIGLIYISCKKEVVYPAANPSTPAVNQNSSIVATSYLGTIVYVPQNVKFSSDMLSIYAEYVIGDGDPCNGGTYAIEIFIYGKQTGVYQLSNHNYAFISEGGFCSPNSFAYYTDSLHTGTVNLTKLDTINHIVSGTFSFTAEEQQPMRNGGATNVTNGVLNNVTW